MLEYYVEEYNFLPQKKNLTGKNAIEAIATKNRNFEQIGRAHV